MYRKRSGLTAPEEHVAPANRYWEGALEIVLRIVLESPSLCAPNVRITQSQNKAPWEYDSVSRVAYEHQLRQIRRREERKRASR